MGRAVIQIEKNIPFPIQKKKECKYPFHKMEVGDSFFYPITNECNTRELQTKIANAAWTWNNRNNKELKFKTTQLEKGVRVWRIQ